MATDITQLRLHARIDEGTGPALVLLHGINSDGGDYRTVIDTIGPGYRFVAFDLLGFGESPKPLDIEYTADEHALVIEKSLLEMGVDDPFLLVGYSLGGDIALRYASTYPDRVRRLFLLDAPFYLPPSALPTKNYGLEYAWSEASKWLWSALATSSQKDNAIYRLATGAIEDPLKEAFHAQDMTTHWEIMSKNLKNTVERATFVDDLPKLTMPVVFAVGVRDAIVKVAQTPALKRLKPDMEIRRIMGLAADHMVLWNMPERVAEEIVRDEVRELNVAWRGGSGEPLVLLHGIQNPAEAWIPAAQVLARTNDVAVIDLLGFGGSPSPQSFHYTASEHAAAVLGTVNALWGNQRPVRFAGEGFGAAVALTCAATVPDRTAGVIAFSPTLLEPGATLDGLASDERAARALTYRDLSKRLASDQRGRTKAAEKAEKQLVPIVRSIENGVLGIDSAALLGQVPPPALFVVPDRDTIIPIEFLLAVAREREGFEVVRVAGDPGLPYAQPAEAVKAIEPDDAEGIALAQHAVPASNALDNPVTRIAGDVEGAFLRAGLLNLAAAAAIVAFNPVSPQLLSFGFAAWIAISSLSAIVGAVGMRRQTSGTRFTFTTTALPTLLLGFIGIGAAALILADPPAARRVIGVLIALYATARGSADLYVATHVGGTNKPRWLLYASGALGIITAAAILFGQNHGIWLVRLSLTLYLALTGASLVAYVIGIRRAAELRVRALVSD